jgi:hypothetical protein
LRPSGDGSTSTAFVPARPRTSRIKSCDDYCILLRRHRRALGPPVVARLSSMRLIETTTWTKSSPRLTSRTSLAARSPSSSRRVPTNPLRRTWKTRPRVSGAKQMRCLPARNETTSPYLYLFYATLFSRRLYHRAYNAQACCMVVRRHQGKRMLLGRCNSENKQERHFRRGKSVLLAPQAHLHLVTLYRRRDDRL